MELADVVDSKSSGSDTVPVRIRLAAPFIYENGCITRFRCLVIQPFLYSSHFFSHFYRKFFLCNNNGSIINHFSVKNLVVNETYFNTSFIHVIAFRVLGNPMYGIHCVITFNKISLSFPIAALPPICARS